jgi:hypothetical protein
MQLFAIAASASALLHSTMVTSAPLVPEGAAPGPLPQNGVWALLPAECETPTSLDLSSWPKCATPIGFADDEVAALERPARGAEATPTAFNSIGRTKYAVAPGAAPDAPAVAQVVVRMVFSRSYYYLAVRPAAPLDADGRFAAARGWPVACLPKAQGGCNPRTLADVQAEAAIEPTDPKRLYRMIRILAPAPSSGDQTAPTPATPAIVAPAGTITETPLPPAKDAEPAAPAPATPAPVTSAPSPPPSQWGQRAPLGARRARRGKVWDTC